MMDESTVADYITKTFPGVETTTNFGYTFFFYGSDHTLPFATIASSDNDNDRVSNLDRPGVFRLNIGVSKQTFQSLFGTAKVDISAYDFTVLDVIIHIPIMHSKISSVCFRRVKRRWRDYRTCWLKLMILPSGDMKDGTKRISPIRSTAVPSSLRFRKGII